MEMELALTTTNGAGSHHSVDRDLLQKRFRNFENDRKSAKSQRESHLMIPRLHQLQIEKLKSGCFKKRWDLFLQTETMKQKCISSHIVQIARLQDQAEWYKRSVATEKQTLTAIRKEQMKLEAELFQRRKDSGGLDSDIKRNQKLERKIKNHENLLDKALVKFNEASNSNQQLKDVIDYLRRERLVFDSVQDKMLREIRKKSRTASSMIESSETLQQESGQYREQMASMKEEIDVELQNVEKSWEEISGRLSQDQQDITDFENIQTLEMQGTSPLQKRHNSTENSLLLKLHRDEERIQTSQEEIKQARKELQLHNAAIVQIQKATRVDDIDHLVNVFVKSEEENFHLFHCVNSLQDNIEEVEGNIDNLKKELSTYRDRMNSGDSKTTRVLRSLRRHVEQADNDCQSYDQESTAATKSLAAICTAVSEMLPRLGLSDAQEAQVLDFSGITDSTIAEYLAVVENYTTDLLQHFVLSKQHDDSGALITHIQHVPVTIVPPTVHDSDGDSENDSDAGETQPLDPLMNVGKQQPDATANASAGRTPRSHRGMAGETAEAGTQPGHRG